MTKSRPLLPRIALLSSLLALSACATMGGGSGDTAADSGIPDDAVPITRTEQNGDVVTEYRVAGQLRVVRVKPSRGAEYFLYDRDGDGQMDKEGDNPPQTYFKLFGWK